MRSSLEISDEAVDDWLPIDEDNGDGQTAVVTSAPETSLARLIARKLMPWAGLLIIGSALVLGILTIRTVNRSIEPEIANRTTLMDRSSDYLFDRGFSAVAIEAVRRDIRARATRFTFSHHSAGRRGW